MPSPFAITTATNDLPLDSNRQGQTSFTVSNTTKRVVRGRAYLVAQPEIAKPWLKLLGEAERNFASDDTEQYGVQITVPLSAPNDNYTFRLDMVDVANPDDDFSEGPTVRFVVAPPPAAVKKPFPWLIVAVVVGLLILLGGGFYGISRQFQPKVVPASVAISTQGLALWLKSDTGTTLNSNGSTVAQWADQSGQGHNVRQSTTSKQPSLVKDVINGEPVLRFNGSSDIMSTVAVVTTSTQYTLFVVSTLDNPSAANGVPVPGPFYNGDSLNSGYGLFSIYPANYGTIDGGISYIPFGSITDRGFQIQEVTCDSKGAEAFYVNGSPSLSSQPTQFMPHPPTKATFVGGISNIPTTTTNVNGTLVPTSNLFNGDIAEIILYNRPLSAAERQSVEQYLKNKYGL